MMNFAAKLISAGADFMPRVIEFLLNDMLNLLECLLKMMNFLLKMIDCVC